MIRSIIFKELLKTRRAFFCCLVLAIFFTGYAIMSVNRVIASHGVEHVWLIMLLKDQTFMDMIKYLPALSGLLIALSQMLPEMNRRRLKLTLHLPFPELKMLMVMLATGLAELTSLFLLQTAAISIYYSRIISSEMTIYVLMSTLPWFIAGYIAYLFVCAICLEGKWQRRIILALTVCAVIYLFFQQPSPGAYNSIIPGVVLLTLLLSLLSYGSILRFRKGLID